MKVKIKINKEISIISCISKRMKLTINITSFGMNLGHIVLKTISVLNYI